MFLDLIFPRHCVGCGQPCGAFEHYVCADCWGAFEAIEAPRCSSCGVGFEGAVADQTVCCPKCTELDPVFDSGLSLLQFKGLTRSFIHTLKYERGLFLKKDLERLLRSLPDAACWVEDAYLVPVPLHKKRQRQRGFNQSEFLAQALEKVAQTRGVVKLLNRVRATQAQVHLTRQQRAQNVRNAFALNSKVFFDKQGTYILVDDVYTTGATLQACAQVLRKCGLEREQIRILTLAHG